MPTVLPRCSVEGVSHPRPETIRESVVGIPVVNRVPVAEVVALSSVLLAHLKPERCRAIDFVVLKPIVADLLPQCSRLSAGREGYSHIMEGVGPDNLVSPSSFIELICTPNDDCPA